MSYRILVVDQDPAGAERIQRPLTEAGYDVVVSSDAGEAMNTFEKVRPDLAVIEALLPEKPGPVLCREIKDSPAGRSTPVVLLLESDEDRQARARSLDLHGCDLLIERSIAGDELIELLEQLLRARLAPTDDAPAEDSPGTAQAPAETASAATSSATRPDPSDKLIDSEGVVDALSRLDAIIEEQQAEHDPQSSPAEAQAAGPPVDDDKVKKAERAGDFSYLREEVEKKKPVSPQPIATSTPGNANEQEPAPDTDAGQDIADHIDALFAATSPGEPTPAEKQVLSWTFENGTAEKAKERTGVPAAKEGGSAKPTAAPRPVEHPAAAPVAAPPVPSAAERPAEAPPQKPAPELARAASRTAASAMQTATFASSARRSEEPRTPAEGGSRWWVVAACLSVVLIGGGLAILFLGGKGAMPEIESPAVSASTLVASSATTPEPVVEAAPMAESPEPTDSGETAEPPERSVPTETAPPSRPAAAPVAAPPRPTPRTVSTKPQAREETTAQVQPPPVATGPQARPAPPRTASPETSAPGPATPQAETPRRAEAPPSAIRETPPRAESAAPKQPRAAEEGPSKVESAEPTAAAPPVRKESPVVAAPPPAPSKPVIEPPELLERTEPDYPAKTLKRARGERIVLKLLISDSGRINRVLVDQGTRFKDLEAAAVSAVLRWKYRPAKENGVPVEAWITAEFTF